VHDGTISQTVAVRVTTELAPVAEQLEMLAEKVGMHGRDQEQVRAAIEHLVEARIMGVARLIRADSEALQALIEERTEVQVDTVRETVDWRLAAFAERIDEKLGSVAEEIAATITERMVTGVGPVDGGDLALAGGQAAVEERLLAHIDDRMSAIARLIRSDNQALATAVREQQAITPSEPLDAELVRQTLRAIKELQAGLADDMESSVDGKIRSISDQLHKETQSTTESMVKVAEVLGEKIDRLSVRVDEGVGSDMQVVIDRMTDAIQAMSATRRSA